MLEQKLCEVDTVADEVVKATKDLSLVTKKLRQASETGDLQQLHRCLTLFSQITERLGAMGANISSILEFEEEAYLGSDTFLNELAEAASTVGVRAVLGDKVLYSYPLAVKVQPQKRLLLVGKHRDSRLRPKFVAQQLKRLQADTGRLAESAFIEVLYSAYKFLLRANHAELGRVVPLSEVYDILTFLPQVSRDYTRHDFSVDVYRLDKSGVQVTKDGSSMTLPASTGTRGTSGVLSIIGDAGGEIRYYGIAFAETRPLVGT
jgi:hypothetical protein